MLSLYFKLAKQDLLKNKYYTFINVFGLVFGMFSALLIAKYIGGSLQFDSFHEKKNNIYSITQEESIGGNPQKNSNSSYWGVGELIHQYPEVIHLTRYSYHVGSLIIAEGETGNRISFLENKIASVDSSFLNVFSFPLRYGNPKKALAGPNAVVITSSTSQRYFGNINPVGKTLTIRVPWGSETVYEVTGVLEEVPQRSQFRFDFLTTQTQLNPDEFWYVPDFSTFLLLKDNVDTKEWVKKLENTLNQVTQLKSTNRQLKVSLKSFANIQLSNTEYLLAAIGIFILLISWLNYINQVIAQSYWRMKKIGILRVMGATRSNLKIQFIVESGLICLTSLICIIAIYLTLEPAFQSITNGHLLPLIGDSTLINFIFLSIFTLGISLTAAIPTVILFSSNFGTTLQNVYRSKIGSVGLRQVLVIVQFSVSTVLMISVFVISNQLDYLKNKDKGMNMENVLIIQAPIVKDTAWIVKRKTVEMFKEKFEELPFVMQVTSSTTVPGESYRKETYLSIQDNSNQSMIHQIGVDEDFFDLYDVKFISGHNFIPDTRWKNKSNIILNESAARALGIIDFDKMINTKIIDHESNEVYDLIGIVKDYHQTSLKYKMRPIAFKFNILRGHFSLRINREAVNNDLEKKLSAIKQIWEQTYQGAPFDYFFLSEKYAAQDKEDQYFGKLFSYFTALSIIISCLGLFGLSLLISTKRQREIGVRKVFGASSVDILTIFLKGYVGSLTLAIVIGSPVAYLMMTMWLRNFAYRIEIGLGLVSLALLCLTLIFLFTVSYHTIKSSFTNPVTVLKD